MTKITVEIETRCFHECDEIRSELSEACHAAELYQARYAVLRGWMVGGFTPEAHDALSCKTNAQLDAAVDKVIGAMK